MGSLKSPRTRLSARALQLRQRPRSFRPRLEILEDRNLLSTYTVDHLADDWVGSGLDGSLRYCVNHAVNGDSIEFGLTGTITLSGALPDLHSISIQGPEAYSMTVVRSSVADHFSIFTVDSGKTVSISGLTISNGDGDYGGGIYNKGTLTLTYSTVSGNAPADYYDGYGSGGGIYNCGTLTLNNSTVSGNLANYGGGITNTGTLTLNNSTVSGNDTEDFLGFSTYGGGIFNNYGTLTLNNSTVSGNSANSGYGSFGGGIASWGGTVTLTNSTVSGNGAGGGIYLEFGVGTLHAGNTIIAGNYAGDLSGNLGSQGHNLIGNTQGGSGFDPTDLLNVNPLLGLLQDNGGPTQTMAMLAGSPALNAGDPTQLGVADQRGVVRSGGVNIGAYQASASAFVLTAPATVTAGVPFDVTVTAVDPFGQVALGYIGTVWFGASDTDPAVVLPAAYTFTAADHGTHTFTGGFTLVTPGQQTLTATDTSIGTLTGNLAITVG
jgi:hypothetical protein